MSSLSVISSNFMKKSIPLYHYTPCLITTRALSLSQTRFNTILLRMINQPQAAQKLFPKAQHSSEVPTTSPPEFPSMPPVEKPGILQEVPRTPNVPEFDPIPPEKPADPPPLSPGPNPGPEFPGPPNPSPPKPDSPRPPSPSPPGQPEVIPPHGPDIIPPKRPEPGPPYTTQPDIPTPFMSSFGPILSKKWRGDFPVMFSW